MKTNSMVHGVSALGISIPRRAPAVEVNSARDEFQRQQRIAVMPTRALIHPKIGRDPRALQTLGLICAHANKSGVTRVSQERIAELAQCSQQAISYTVNKLRAAGLIETWTTPGPGKYAMNMMRVLFEPKLDKQAATSISSPPITNLSIGNRPHQPSIGNRASIPMPTQIDDRPITNLDGLPITNPIVGRNWELLKNSTNKLETADEVIRQWLAFAWKHGQHTPIADEQDLATAHELVARHITAEQLETAVIADPEADQLAPLVRSLLS